MANPTTNFGWVMPNSTDLVTDLPADFAVFGQGVDTSMAQLKGGTTGQILSKTSNTDMAFTWITNDQGDITAVNAGTGLTGGGTTGSVTLALDSTAVIAPTIVDAKGDLIAATAADTVSRLAVGTNGQVLTADSTAATGIKWATPAAGGGFTVIASGSLSGNSLNLTSIPQTYKYIRLQMLNIKTTATGAALQMTFNGEGLSGQSTYVSTGVKTNQAGTASAYSPTGWSGSYALLGLSGGFAGTTTTLANLTLDWNNYSDTTSAKIGSGSSYMNYNSNATAQVNIEQILWRNANAISQITIKVESTDTYSAGTYVLYGVN